jgi:CHAD domain-containing protein
MTRGDTWHRACTQPLAVAFELKQRKHLEEALRKIVRRQLRNTAAGLRDAGDDSGPAVHEARKSVKKVRAAVEVLEQAGASVPRQDRRRLKRAAQALSRLRDSAAMIDTLERVRRRYPAQLPEHTYGILRRGLVNARDRMAVRARREGVIGDVVERLEKTRRAAKTWTADRIGRSEFFGVIADSYRRSRKAMTRASDTRQAATLHRWRKAAKTFWYQLRLARPAIGGAAPLVADLKRLETMLGEDHDLVVLVAAMRACRDLRSSRAAIRQVQRLTVRMRQPLRRSAFELGRRLHNRKPRAFARWIRASSQRPPQRTAA